jgi:4-amino-4-deoxy-L-arabinose transferase-like glycosyltransferase
VFYPPLYPYFIAVPYALFGTLGAAKGAQLVVGTLLVPTLGRLGRRVFGERVGLGAAAIAAFYPELVWFSVHFWSETLFMAFLWWAFERLVEADARGAAGVAAAAGALWGLAILTRETVLYFTPVAALFLLAGTPRNPAAWRRAALFVATALLTVMPWTWRNYKVFGAFVPVSTAGGLNLYQGNAPLTRQEVYDRYEAVQGRIEQYRFARQAGIEAILARQPFWLPEKLRDEMPKFWEADSLALIHIKRGAYGLVPVWVTWAAAFVVLVPYLAVLSWFVRSIGSLPLSRGVWLLLAFLAYYNLIHVVTHGFARYRLPAMPVLFLCAAWAWRSGNSTVRARRTVVALLAVALGAALVPSLLQNARHPAFGLATTDDAPP